jgi:membrane protein implicated in regulation of membrane protease activity
LSTLGAVSGGPPDGGRNRRFLDGDETGLQRRSSNAEFDLVPDWTYWLIAAGILLVGEMVATSFILGPLGLAAAGAAICAAAGGSIEGQVAAFVALSAVTLIAIRPIAKRHKKRPPEAQRTNADTLIGSEALVLVPVDRDSGQVKVEGDVWSARSENPALEFEAGQRVVVSSVHRGTILRVSARDTDTSEQGSTKSEDL